MTDEDRSNARYFLSRIRDDYTQQLLVFVAEQRRNSLRGEAEVKLDLEPGTKAFRSMTCADFVRNDGQPEIIEFTPEHLLGFDPVAATLGNADLKINQLQWDGVVIRHDASFDPERILGGWFERWFDPDDRRYQGGADLGNVIHSLVVEPGQLTIDFGSAAPDAFWEILELLEKAGATEISIGGSPEEAVSA